MVVFRRNISTIYGQLAELRHVHSEAMNHRICSIPISGENYFIAMGLST